MAQASTLHLHLATPGCMSTLRIIILAYVYNLMPISYGQMISHYQLIFLSYSCMAFSELHL